MSAQAGTKGRERQETILRAIYEVSNHTTKLCAYEDVVVQAWKLAPEEFGLRGYTHEYPDASDLHKPLYGPLKREGLVRSQNKKFALTERGLASVEQALAPSRTAEQRGRLGRDQKAELARLAERPAVSLVLDGRVDELLDTDMYDFYAVTVRTPAGDFAGRVATVDAAIDAAVDTKDPSVDLTRVAAVRYTRDRLRERFTDLIRERSASKTKTTKR